MVSTAFEGGNGQISCCFLEKTPISIPENEVKAENFRCEVTSLCEGTCALPVGSVPNMETLCAIAASLNMKIFNPPNQDGVNCQFAAILEQLQLLRCLPSELNTVGLKRLAFTGLAEHGDDIIDAQWDDLSRRSDTGSWRFCVLSSPTSMSSSRTRSVSGATIQRSWPSASYSRSRTICSCTSRCARHMLAQFCVVAHVAIRTVRVHPTQVYSSLGTDEVVGPPPSCALSPATF